MGGATGSAALWLAEHICGRSFGSLINDLWSKPFWLSFLNRWCSFPQKVTPIPCCLKENVWLVRDTWLCWCPEESLGSQKRFLSGLLDGLESNRGSPVYPSAPRRDFRSTNMLTRMKCLLRKNISHEVSHTGAFKYQWNTRSFSFHHNMIIISAD